MKRIGIAFAVAGWVVSSVALAQSVGTATGPAAEAQRSYNSMKGNIMKAAEKMPASDYSFKPTPEIRSFARVVNHVTEAQYRVCGTVNRVAADALPKTPADTADKDAILEALKGSFAECDKAYASATDANLVEVFDLFQAKRSRIGALWGNVAHDDEQYATLALYLRLKGIVPPSSEK